MNGVSIVKPCARRVSMAASIGMSENPTSDGNETANVLVSGSPIAAGLAGAAVGEPDAGTAVAGAIVAAGVAAALGVAVTGVAADEHAPTTNRSTSNVPNRTIGFT